MNPELTRGGRLIRLTLTECLCVLWCLEVLWALCVAVTAWTGVAGGTVMVGGVQLASVEPVVQLGGGVQLVAQLGGGGVQLVVQLGGGGVQLVVQLGGGGGGVLGYRLAVPLHEAPHTLAA